MMYSLVKHIHMSAVGLTLGLFILRLFWVATDSARLQQRWVKILPHVIDTTLLASAITLVVISAQYPWQQAWLAAKVIALLVYIVLGTYAIKRGPTKQIKLLCGAAALLVIAYIIGVARSHSVWPLA